MTEVDYRLLSFGDVQTFSERELRDTLGQFCTGVTVVTTVLAGRPAGFACQSFAALSLDPPLVVVAPSKLSRTWESIERTRTFAVNVLSHDQHHVSEIFGGRSQDKFAHIDWETSPLGNALIPGVLATIDCTLDQVLDGGDHYIAVGRVQHLGQTRHDRPLLFYRGGYLSTEHETVKRADSDIPNIVTWDKSAPDNDQL